MTVFLNYEGSLLPFLFSKYFGLNLSKFNFLNIKAYQFFILFLFLLIFFYKIIMDYPFKGTNLAKN